MPYAVARIAPGKSTLPPYQYAHDLEHPAEAGLHVLAAAAADDLVVPRRFGVGNVDLLEVPPKLHHPAEPSPFQVRDDGRALGSRLVNLPFRPGIAQHVRVRQRPLVPRGTGDIHQPPEIVGHAVEVDRIQSVVDIPHAPPPIPGGRSELHDIPSQSYPLAGHLSMSWVIESGCCHDAPGRLYG